MGVKLPEKEIKTLDGEGSARVTITLDSETLKLLDRYKARTAHKNPMADTAMAIKLLLEADESKSESAKSTQGFAGKMKQKEDRQGVSRSTKAEVLERDQGCCQYRDPKTGKKCESIFKIEIDHRIPWSKGGKTRLDNLQCYCFNHNQMKSNHV
jgi:hypothetical protein